jgi:translation initiation factor IF-1
MVRNINGGTGTKGIARKHQNNQSSHGNSRLPSCDLEVIACVTKMLGNGMCSITTSTNLNLMGHIRNKFKGRHKRQNNITPLSFVLIGLRQWESVPKNCDILYIYDEREIESFNSIPSLKLNNIISLRNQSFDHKSSSNMDNDLFSYSIHDEIDDIMPTKSLSIIKDDDTNINNDDDIDIDDI